MTTDAELRKKFRIYNYQGAQLVLLDTVARVVREMDRPLPPEVIAWRDAYGSYIAAMGAYNDRLQAIRTREAEHPEEFGRDNPNAEWKAVDAANAKWHSLLMPMYEALSTLGVKEADHG